jgi:hypothetical protein
MQASRGREVGLIASLETQARGKIFVCQGSNPGHPVCTLWLILVKLVMMPHSIVGGYQCFSEMFIAG